MFLLSVGYSNRVKLFVKISVLKHASKCGKVIQKCLHLTGSDICKLDTNPIAEQEL